MRSLFPVVLLSLCRFSVGECPAGTVRGLRPSDCYYYANDGTDWVHAEDECVARGGHLASVHNAFANSIFSTFPSVGATNEYWLGGSVRMTSSSDLWTWTDGSPFDYKNWASNPSTSSSLCLFYNLADRKWYTSDCESSRGYICEVPGTNSSVAVPTPSRQAGYCESGWTYLDVTRKCYKLLQGMDTWTAFEAMCNMMGAHLTSIHSAEEQLFIRELSGAGQDIGACNAKGQCPFAWIGLSDRESNGHYKWIDGTPLDYTDWTKGRPYTNNGDKNYACYYPDEWPYDEGFVHHWDVLAFTSHPMSRAAVCKKDSLPFV